MRRPKHHLSVSDDNGAKERCPRLPSAWLPALALATLLPLTGPALGEQGTAGVTLENTQEVTLASSFKDQSYLIQVALPHDYAGSEASYPVVYLLDSNILFGLLTDVTRLLPLEGVPMFLGRQRVPKVIVVGIGYPGGLAEMSSKRGWDMNPPEGDNGEVNPDGATNFHRFLSSDLIPWVESSYRTKPSDRTLLGVSRGGVFALSTLFLHPETFQRYIAISPTIEPPIYDYLEAYSKREEGPRPRLFLSSGSAGDIETAIAGGVSSLVDKLDAVDASRLEWSAQTLDGESHLSVVSKALVEALVSVFSEADT